ncbi:MAG: pyrimidine-specific ribonucleoside hydrolase [Phenylobacterium sp.]|jgi:pyrimidine-specific ribonucleoside hydrolase
MSTAKKVIIDSDGGFDDYMSIGYLLQNPDIEVVAICLTGCGTKHLNHGVTCVSNIITMFNPDRWQLPILKGPTAPLTSGDPFIAALLDVPPCVYNIDFPEASSFFNIQNAQPWLTDFFLNSAGPVSVLSIGGATNLGTLFNSAKTHPALDTAIRAKLDRIVMMGGNLTPQYVTSGGTEIIPSLIGASKVAGWNIFIDPPGAELVFNFGVPVTFIGLNATPVPPLSSSFISQMNQLNTGQADFVAQVFNYPNTSDGAGTVLSMWDPLAACALANPSVLTTEPYHVILQHEPPLPAELDELGAEIILPPVPLIDGSHGALIDVATSANNDAVYAEYLRVFAL